MKEADLEALKERERQLQKLKASGGWAYLREIMETEMMQAALQIASIHTASMSLDEINFRRGAIWSASQLLTLPDTLLSRLEGEIMMGEAALSKSTSEPAKAGFEATEKKT